jgi:NAD(P)-dependent dehydrogenase (short-subunit alcohol dehydrogenase family)
MGAVPGTGQSLVKIFARAGHPVAIVSRTLSKLQTQADEINALVKQSDRVKPFAADATDEAAVEKAFSDIQDAFKPARIHTDGPRSSAFASLSANHLLVSISRRTFTSRISSSTAGSIPHLP